MFSSNSCYNIIITIFTVFLISLKKIKKNQEKDPMELVQFMNGKGNFEDSMFMLLLCMFCTKRETFINLRNDLWLFTVPKKAVGTLSCYNNTEKIDPRYRTEIMLQDAGAITIKQGCRLVTKEQKCANTFNHNQQKHHEPKNNKLSRNKLVFLNPEYKQQRSKKIHMAKDREK